MSIKHERLFHSLVFGALGDTLGMPWENKSRTEILDLTHGKGVAGFVDPAKIRTDAQWQMGQYTDDTQLSLVVAESLIASGGWNPTDCMHRHVRAMHESIAGWGGTTKRAVAAFATAYASDVRFVPDVSRPPMAAPGRGGGNGPLMKVAPLALATVCEQGSTYTALLRDRCRELSFLTHSDPDVAIATFAGACFIAQGLVEPILHRLDGINFLERVISEVKEMELLFARLGYPSEWQVPLSRELEQIPDVLEDYDRLLALCENESRPFVARTSAVLAIALFLRNIGNPETAMLEAVNAGGDTDTNAAIVGNICGSHGATFADVPVSWETFLSTYEEQFLPVLELSNSLADCVLS